MARLEGVIERLDVSVFTIPTDRPESDGTLEWTSTTMVLVEAISKGTRGVGYTYADASVAQLVRGKLAAVVEGVPVSDVPRAWSAMVRTLRNAGARGPGAMAIGAIDAALWDLKARLMGVSLSGLLGQVRDGVPVYGSGGFTSYTVEELQDQLSGWAKRGYRMVKMKVGRDAPRDPERVHAARQAVGAAVELCVDANGAYTRKQALRMAEAFADDGVSWFEEPVPSDDLEGLRLIRDHGPPGMDIAAGEYGDDLTYFRRMVEAGAVDVLQADATRCMGITGFLKVGSLCEAFGIPLSAHTAPALHLAACCALPSVTHAEWFHDHARIEALLFDGVVEPKEGLLHPDTSRVGNGLELKRAEAERWAA